MSSNLSNKVWKSFDWALCKSAAGAFNTIQFFNKYNPNPSFTPKWSDKPILKSWEKIFADVNWHGNKCAVWTPFAPILKKDSGVVSVKNCRNT